MFGSIFGSTKKKALNEAVQATGPLIITIEKTGGIPNGFWHDKYILGYLNCYVSMFANESNGGYLPGDIYRSVVMKAFAYLSKTDGKTISRKIAECYKSNDKYFMRGMENAYICIMYDFDPYIFNNEPSVIEAEKRAKAMSDVSYTFGETTV